MIAVTKLIAYENRIRQILVMVLKNRSNEIGSNEIRIRRELPAVGHFWILYSRCLV